MKRLMNISLLLVLVSLSPVSAMAGSIEGVDAFLQQLKGVSSFDAARNKDFWMKQYPADGKPRSCSTCHGDNLSKNGKHAKTGKTIDPMAVSVNPERYTKVKKIKKWFKRNCKWTLGRECTAQEQGDVIQYLRSL